MANKKIFILTQYNSSPSTYDKRYQSIQQAKHRVAERLNPARNRTLDVGIGTGIVFSIVPPSNQYVGLDLSINSLKRLKVRYPAQRGLLLNADADYLPIRDGVFPKIISITALQNLPSLSETLREIRRILGPHGRFTLAYLRRSLSPDFQRLLKPVFAPCQIKVVDDPSLEDIFYQIDLKDEN